MPLRIRHSSTKTDISDDGQLAYDATYHPAKSGWRLWVELGGAFASIFAVALSVARLSWFSDQLWPVLVLVWLLGYVTYLTRRTRTTREEYERRSRYAAIAKELHGVQHSIRDAEWMLIQVAADKELVLREIKQALSNVARAFSIVTGAPCRACVKQVAFMGDPADIDLDQILVKTLSRDTTPYPGAVEGPYPIAKSTSFEELALGRERAGWWMSNDLYEQPAPYKNQSIPPGQNVRYLKYRSTAIWPIRKSLSVDQRFDDLRGFLCIDSPATEIFEGRFDFDLGASFADSFYTLMWLLVDRHPDIDLRDQQSGLTEPADSSEDQRDAKLPETRAD